MKTIKVTIWYDDGSSRTAEGKEAEKWADHCNAVSSLAYAHSMNPFDNDPVKWIETKATKLK